MLDLSLKTIDRVTNLLQWEDKRFLYRHAFQTVVFRVIDTLLAAFEAFLKLSVDIEGSAFPISFNADVCPFTFRQDVGTECEGISVTSEGDAAGVFPIGINGRVRALEKYTISTALYTIELIFTTTKNVKTGLFSRISAFL